MAKSVPRVKYKNKKIKNNNLKKKTEERRAELWEWVRAARLHMLYY